MCTNKRCALIRGVYLQEVWTDKRCALTLKGMHLREVHVLRRGVYLREVCTNERCVIMNDVHIERRALKRVHCSEAKDISSQFHCLFSR